MLNFTEWQATAKRVNIATAAELLGMYESDFAGCDAVWIYRESDFITETKTGELTEFALVIATESWASAGRDSDQARKYCELRLFHLHALEQMAESKLDLETALDWLSAAIRFGQFSVTDARLHLGAYDRIADRLRRGDYSAGDAFAQIAARLGFENWHTGGGCRCYGKAFARDLQLLWGDNDSGIPVEGDESGWSVIDRDGETLLTGEFPPETSPEFMETELRDAIARAEKIAAESE